jgi:putative tricarboxylic transport membrane protein
MIKEHPEIFWGVVASMYVGNALLLVLNLPLIGLWVQLLRIPYAVLFPLILLLCMIGVYGTSGNVWDIVIMLVFGAVGYLMRKLGYEAAPLVLAFVLGRLAEESIRQSLLLSRGSLAILLDRPLAAVFLVMTGTVLLASWLRRSGIPSGHR